MQGRECAAYEIEPGDTIWFDATVFDVLTVRYLPGIKSIVFFTLCAGYNQPCIKVPFCIDSPVTTIIEGSFDV